MNQPRWIIRAATLLVAASAGAPLFAQTAPALDSEEEVIVLSPFEVATDRDLGYTATSTLAGGRLATEIGTTPVSVSVLTREFLDDVAATDFLAASRWFANATPNVLSEGPQTFNDYGVSVRGFRSGFPFRNFFISYINTDSYATERLDGSRGPNALVFGDTKVGGAINVSTKRARSADLTRFTYRYNSFGGPGRFTFDVNRRILDNWWIRVAGLWQDENDWQDFTGTERQGIFATTTWKPFETTTVRLEVESYTQFRRVFGTRLTDQVSSWDTTTTLTGPITGNNNPAGINRISGGGNLYYVWNPAAPELGVVNYHSFGQTIGSGVQLDVRPPAGRNTRFPNLPSEEYTIRFDNAGVDQSYFNVSAFLEQQIGDNIFLELAYSHADNRRIVDQLSTENLRVDINQNLPGGATNPFFGQRYVEVDAYQRLDQANYLDEVRLSGAYLLDLDWSDHRFFMGGGFRRDAYRDNSDYAVLMNPGYRGGNPFQNNNRLRYRLYENDRGSDVSLPPNSRFIKFSFFPGEDKDLGYYQAALASNWFRDDRLRTLVGFRRDQFSAFGVTASTDPTTGEFTVYNERASGRKLPSVNTISGGLLYQVTDGIAPYINYAEGFDTTTAGNMLNPATGALDIPLPPKDQNGFEAGVKFTLFEGRVSGSVAYYQNEQTNDSNTGVGIPRNEINRLWNVVDNVTTSPRQIPSNWTEVIDYKGHGWEFDMTANLTPSWRLIFNVGVPTTEIQGGWANTIAYVNNNIAQWEATLATLIATNDSRRTNFENDLNTVRSRIISVGNGRTLPGTFDYTANLFTNYEFREGFLQGFRIGGGVNVRGARLVQSAAKVSTDPSTVEELKAAAFDLWSLTAGYRTQIFGQRVDFQLNVENLFDEQFPRYTGYDLVNLTGNSSAPRTDWTFVGGSYIRQPPRQILLSVRLDF